VTPTEGTTISTVTPTEGYCGSFCWSDC
jgi:hypothetical protein